MTSGGARGNVWEHSGQLPFCILYTKTSRHRVDHLAGYFLLDIRAHRPLVFFTNTTHTHTHTHTHSYIYNLSLNINFFMSVGHKEGKNIAPNHSHWKQVEK